jgi:hypothetical protein
VPPRRTVMNLGSRSVGRITALLRLPNGLRYLRVGGRGQGLGVEKTRSQKNA